jgi:hypothetical protein
MSELLTLSLTALESMRDDFEDQYTTLFSQGHTRLLRLLKIKNLAIKFHQRHKDDFKMLNINHHVGYEVLDET